MMHGVRVFSFVTWAVLTWVSYASPVKRSDQVMLDSNGFPGQNATSGN